MYSLLLSSKLNKMTSCINILSVQIENESNKQEVSINASDTFD